LWLLATNPARSEPSSTAIGAFLMPKWGTLVQRTLHSIRTDLVEIAPKKLRSARIQFYEADFAAGTIRFFPSMVGFRSSAEQAITRTTKIKPGQMIARKNRDYDTNAAKATKTHSE
jgi:hypothetical protein